MKKNLTLITTVFLILFTLSSFANVLNPLKEKNTKVIVTSYLEAIAQGSDLYHKYLFADDFEYTNTANQDKFNRKQYLKFLKATKGFKFDCYTDYQILDETGKSCVAKAIIKFPNFSRVDFITLTKTDDGWKVSKVVTTYP